MPNQIKSRKSGFLNKKRARLSGFAIFLVCTFCWVAASTSAQTEVVGAEAELSRLNTEFHRHLNDYLTSKLASSGSANSSKNIQWTSSEILKRARASETPLDSLLVVRSGMPVWVQQASNADFQALLQILYDANDHYGIEKVNHMVKQHFDEIKVSISYFMRAKFLFDRGRWAELKKILVLIDDKSLQLGDSHYLYLMSAYLLQETKHHRKSVKIYDRIPQDSPYYPTARLNIGTAYLRQGWWTDANLEFKKSIDELVRRGEENDFINRVLVVLGYSQLHYEFYRDARNTFRRVELGSDYANKALMGLGLAAAHQEDFAGALNAFRRLAQMEIKDTNVDESYLLLPYGFQELNDVKKAAKAYEDAINYYELRLLEVSSVASKLGAASIEYVPDLVAKLNQSAKVYYLSDQVVSSVFLSNYSLLLDMTGKSKSKKIDRRTKALILEYNNSLKKAVSGNIKQRETVLQSYLSQAKFGVAKLYDKK